MPSELKSLPQKAFQSLLVYVSGPRFQLALDRATTAKILALFDKGAQTQSGARGGAAAASAAAAAAPGQQPEPAPAQQPQGAPPVARQRGREVAAPPMPTGPLSWAQRLALGKPLAPEALAVETKPADSSTPGETATQPPAATPPADSGDAPPASTPPTPPPPLADLAQTPTVLPPPAMPEETQAANGTSSEHRAAAASAGTVVATPSPEAAAAAPLAAAPAPLPGVVVKAALPPPAPVSKANMSWAQRVKGASQPEVGTAPEPGVEEGGKNMPRTAFTAWKGAAEASRAANDSSTAESDDSCSDPEAAARKAALNPGAKEFKPTKAAAGSKHNTAGGNKKVAAAAIAVLNPGAKEWIPSPPPRGEEGQN